MATIGARVAFYMTMHLPNVARIVHRSRSGRTKGQLGRHEGSVLHAAVAASLEKTSIPLKWTDEFKRGLRIRAVQHREHYGTFVLKRLLKAESMFDMLIEA